MIHHGYHWETILGTLFLRTVEIELKDQRSNSNSFYTDNNWLKYLIAANEYYVETQACVFPGMKGEKVWPSKLK